MTDDKKISERDAVMRERAAFAKGMRTSLRTARRGTLQEYADLPGDEALLTVAARRVYPMPKVKRPRVVRDKWGVKWMSPDGDVVQWQEVRDTTGWHYGLRDLVVDAARTAIFADLLATPFELVDADD